MKGLRKTVIIILVVWIFFTSPTSYAMDLNNVSVYDIKAAFVYNFLKFIEFKNKRVQKDCINICVCSNEVAKKSFERLQGKKIGSKIIKVRFLNNLKNKVYICNVLFLQRDVTKNLEYSKFLDKINSMGILSISDLRNFAEYGGIIELFPQNNKIRFKINLRSAEKANIKIHARLLQLARGVIK